MATTKAQGLYDVADPYFDPDDSDKVEQLFNENNHFFILFWLLPFRQTKKKDWSRILKEMQEPSFPSLTTTLSPMLYKMRL